MQVCITTELSMLRDGRTHAQRKSPLALVAFPLKLELWDEVLSLERSRTASTGITFGGGQIGPREEWGNVTW